MFSRCILTVDTPMCVLTLEQAIAAEGVLDITDQVSNHDRADNSEHNLSLSNASLSLFFFLSVTKFVEV